MTFRETLEKHLRAIESRDLASLRATLPGDELVLVMSDGKVVRSVAEYVEAHRQWFEMPDWTIRFEPIEMFEGVDIAVAVFRLEYSDVGPDHTRIHEPSVLTLTFARRGDGWMMVHDQNTPIKQA
jgi:ketosteroid isomerase-like protein